MTDPTSTDGACRLARRVLDEVERAVVGKHEAADAGARRPPGQGARPPRGLPGARQDPGRPLLRPGPRPRLRAGAVHPRPAARRPHRLVPLRPARGAVRVPPRAASSPACCSPTRSTAPRRRPSPRCSRRCRSARSPSRARPSSLPEPFHVLATANPIEYEGTYPLPEAQLDRFLLRVSFGYPTARRGVRRPRAAGSPGGRRRSTLDAGHRRRRAAGAAGGRRDGRRSTRASAATASHLAAATREHPDVLTGASPRGSLGLVLTARALGAAAGPRLRHPRGREGGGPLGARRTGSRSSPSSG